MVRRFRGSLLVTPPCRTLRFVYICMYMYISLFLTWGLCFVPLKHHIPENVMYYLHSLPPVSLRIPT